MTRRNGSSVSLQDAGRDSRSGSPAGHLPPTTVPPCEIPRGSSAGVSIVGGSSADWEDLLGVPPDVQDRAAVPPIHQRDGTPRSSVSSRAVGRDNRPGSSAPFSRGQDSAVPRDVDVAIGGRRNYHSSAGRSRGSEYHAIRRHRDTTRALKRGRRAVSDGRFFRPVSDKCGRGEFRA